MKKIIMSLLMLLGLCSVFGNIDVRAANTTDTEFLYYVDVSTSPAIPQRKKTNSTPIFVISKENSPTYVKVKAERKNANGNWVTETVGSEYVRLKRRIKSSIRTTIYEHRGSISQPYARLRFKFDNESGTVWGYWSPDSQSTYTVLN